MTKNYPPASEASREVANLVERKKICIPLYMVSNNLSVRPSVTNFDPQLSQDWLNRMGKKIHLYLIYFAQAEKHALASRVASRVIAIAMDHSKSGRFVLISKACNCYKL